MSKIAYFCIPAHGHTNPTLPVVRELVARGHEVWYYSYEPMREKIQSTGAKYISCDKYDIQMNLKPEDADRVGKDIAFSTEILAKTTLALDEAILDAGLHYSRFRCLLGKAYCHEIKCALRILHHHFCL